MEIIGTKEAFAQMLEIPALYKYLEVDTSTVANWKRYVREGKSISTDKMEELLLKFGARVKQEKIWEMNIITYNNRWVSVADRLPNFKDGTNESVDVLVKVEGFPDRLERAVYTDKGWREASRPFGIKVTEWQDETIPRK